MTSRPAQHRAVLSARTEVVPDHERPTPGPIAILPTPSPLFARAIESAGGTVAELSPETRGIVWLDQAGAEEFARAFDAHPGVEWVQLPWAGVDAFADVLAREAASPRPRLIWTSAKGAYAQPVAEHALTLMLALLRDLPTRVGARSWGPKAGTSLYGLNVVIVGAGGIALELLRLLEPFGVRSTVVRRSSDPVAAAGRTVSSDLLHEVLPEADVVVLAAALTAEGTSRMLGAREFELMRDSAYVVNIARGGLIETDALVEALMAGRIAGAALDVTDPEPLPDGHPLWSAPGAIITPHTADTPEMTSLLLAERLRHNVRAFLSEGDFQGRVDPASGY
ncbi:D-isomer specific 2-hydroxyacid dehydrogenase family protein [Herbiconiux sp. CPCC 203407]|uniref:D-isomer specific 2-hydroxyacid dehydrogenase family protein n=1 Tax=Herbiconiux oxytropis TaxID=2970915 RepID=A0AA41XGM9_9MICO|nr:D-isomer specific 2-hydroxyacid dehydrogenase family protein [Herbiconiux oxytropis]MCS5720530.1 D-isomer specific 2-hydroxyacid dehydrogenase family protein [Herbiconiux oxytropis]MCS5726103.1 D-isomer specific 2-hydroxyacid dehydrogenase family protein [Herbiconiux oxytropis]